MERENYSRCILLDSWLGGFFLGIVYGWFSSGEVLLGCCYRGCNVALSVICSIILLFKHVIIILPEFLHRYCLSCKHKRWMFSSLVRKTGQEYLSFRCSATYSSIYVLNTIYLAYAEWSDLWPIYTFLQESDHQPSSALKTINLSKNIRAIEHLQLE